MVDPYANLESQIAYFCALMKGVIRHIPIYQCSYIG